MSKVISDAHLWLTEVGATDPTPNTITSITQATPPVVTPTTMPPGITNGDFVVFDATGVAYLDGYSFRIDAVGATSFELPDVESTDIPAAVSTGNFLLYSKAGTSAMLEACMASITLTGQAPDTINMDDMCGTSMQYGDAKPPTFSFQGWSDQDSEGYLNLWRASVENPKPIVQCLIDYGAGGGYVFGLAQIGEITINAVTAQGLQFSGAGVFTEVPTYSWAL